MNENSDIAQGMIAKFIGVLVFFVGVGPIGSSVAVGQEKADKESGGTNPADKSDPSSSNDSKEDSAEQSGSSKQSSGEQTEKKEEKKTDEESNAEKQKKPSRDGESKKSGGGSVGGSMPPEAGPEFKAELQEFRNVYERYSNEVSDYQKTIDSIVDAAYKEKKAKITDKFDRRAEQVEAMERKRRKGAIERFKKFIKQHPDRPTYTPDAMYRLAELYFEKANDAYLQADEAYQKKMKAYNAGRRPSRPEPPRKDYSKTIETFSNLVRDWPDYRLLDGAYYLLAYCHDQMGNARKARDLFSELIVKRPKSEFVPEAWLRIGEYHFDRSDSTQEIQRARFAYRQAMKYENSKYFDKALYKLAWSNYRLDNFPKAIENFKRLAEWRDESGEKSGSVLRKEAIRYIAISLAQEDWDLDRSVDDAFVMPRVKKYLGEGKPYERKVLSHLVDFLFEHTRHDRAVKVIRYALDKHPNHPDNPKLHKKLIQALIKPPERLQESFEERRKLIELYGPGSDWFAYQKKHGNEEAVDYGQSLIRDNLIKAATWYHEQAQKAKEKARSTKDQELLAQARKKYRKAAKAYKRFLKRYPDDKDIYRWNFFYADSLYYGGQYEKAYEQYRVVRELDLKDNKFQANAGFNAIKAMEFRIKKLVDEGKLPNSVVPGASRKEARKTARKQNKKGKSKKDEKREKQKKPKEPKIEEKEIPDIVKEYITAMDRYVVLGLDYEDGENLTPKFAFNAAKLFYDYKHYDTARTRFEWIVEKYPKREEAFLAGSLILEMYRQEEKYDKLAKWADRLESSGVLSGKGAKKVRKEVREFKLGALFKSAEKLFNQEKYEKAAQEYVKLVDRAPDHENAPRALNNAAVAYEEIKKYESALKLYKRVYREYPKSELAGYALYRVAVNSERFFEFDDAANNYMRFYAKFTSEVTPDDLEQLGFSVKDDDTYMTFYEQETPKKPEALEAMGFEVAEKKPKSLLSAGVLSANLQEFERAAKIYEMYVKRYPNRDQAPGVQWQAVETWKRAGKTEAMIDAFKTYKREFGSDPERAANVLDGMMRIAEYYEQQGKKEDAVEQYKAIIKTFEKRGLKPEKKPRAAYYPAKAQFRLAERKFAEWKKIKIDGDLENQKKKLKKKLKEQKKVAKEFKKVWSYKSLDYTLASGFRIGSMYQQFAEALYNVPVPYERGTRKFLIYKKQMNKQARPLEKEAIKRWKKTIEKAREAKIVNKWTKKTLTELNKFRPKEYPLYKESRTAKETRTKMGASLLTQEPEIKKGKFDESRSGPPGSEKGGESKGDSKDEGASNERNSKGDSGSSSNEKGSSESAGGTGSAGEDEASSSSSNSDEKSG